MNLDNIRVVLSHTSHPGNIGAAARAMKTMGLSRLALVNPKRFPDAMADAMAAGASDLLVQAEVCTTLDEALHDSVFTVGLTARHRGLSHAMLTLREAAPRVLERANEAPVVLLFGHETSGLSNEELERCQMLITIPVNPDYSSLNLAAAVQVVAYELRTCAIPASKAGREFEGATASELEQFYEHLERTLIEIEFLNPKHPKRLMTRLRRLFSRTELEREEVSILRGILKLASPKTGRNNS
ncbi:MAG: RNA methyltransferase [Sulfuricellaceae bacterium]|nr:RNA methyltransferase [Sulfuricellaceae bacterium]